ncbi:hypothetical protein ABTW96_09040 [Nocardia beijingensis]|uniref:hypothetical protein n=1 Tax=Nocardia beijingensis TaxID=95162 RepID=UPI00331A0044
MSWPAAFLASVIVVAGFCYHYMLINRGIDPMQAVQYLMMIEIPLVALVLPVSSVGAAARAVCRVLSRAFGNLGGGGTQ